MSDDRCDLLCLDLERAEAIRARVDPALAAASAARAKALSDPTRLLIAVALRDGDELCVCDLSWVVEKPQNLVSHHIRQLRAAGLARSRRDGKMVMYELTASARAALDALLSGVRAAA